MSDLTLKSAQAIIDAALAGGRTGPERRIAIAVCDAGGHPLALGREEDAAPLLAHIAQAKAFTCIAYGKSTDAVREWAEETPMVSLTNASLPGLGDAFSARVIFHDNRYAGTWQHGDVGGHLFGTIEPAE